jgi:hypothetical protein
VRFKHEEMAAEAFNDDATYKARINQVSGWGVAREALSYPSVT